MRIQLSDHFTVKRLVCYAIPSVITLIFTSIYSIVDGFFVSNFVGKEPFTAVNFIMPFLMVLGACGFMFGTGGGAWIAKKFGEGDKGAGNRAFSLVVYASIVCGAALTVLGFILLRPVASLMGASGDLLENCMRYGRVMLIGNTAYTLQYEFQCLFATAEKPKLGLVVTLAAGLTNIILDAVFIIVFGWGVEGAAAASILGMFVGGIIPLIYFARPNTSLLRLGKTSFDGPALKQVCLNGMSELVSSISMSVVGMLYNIQLLKYAGENGVASYGVLMYVSMIFVAVFIGYSMGTAPIISYNYGAQNHAELRGVKNKSFAIIGTASVLMFLAGFFLSRPISALYVGYDEELLEMTVYAFSIFSFSFLFCGFAIYSSSFFTALNNGPISAIISLLRTFVFQISAVILLPLIFGVDGIWYSLIVAEVMAIIVAFIFLKAKKKQYNY